MANLTESHAAAVRACVALLEAFDPNHTSRECQNFLRLALESAMDATGIPDDTRPKAEDLLDCYDFRRAEPA